MTMRLSLSRATVTAPDETVTEKALVMSSNGRLRVLNGSDTVYDGEASAVRPTGRRMWEIDTPLGTWKVVKPAGCGCGK